MRLQVKGKNVEVSPSMREYAERKLAKLDKQLAEPDAGRGRAVRAEEPVDRREPRRRGDDLHEGHDPARARGVARHEGRRSTSSSTSSSARSSATASAASSSRAGTRRTTARRRRSAALGLPAAATSRSIVASAGRPRTAALDDAVSAAPSLAAEPPGWDGEARGEPGIHGVAARAPLGRRRDGRGAAAAGRHVHFVALARRHACVVEEDEPDDGASTPLADAVDGRRSPPVPRRGGAADGDHVGGRRARGSSVVEVPGLSGDEAELVVTREGRTLRSTGDRRSAAAPALERPARRWRASTSSGPSGSTATSGRSRQPPL